MVSEKLYRLSNKFYRKKMYKTSIVIDRVHSLINNSIIPGSANLGVGHKFAYGGIGIVIHKDTVAGKNVMFGQNITVGGSSSDKRSNNPINNEVPMIGDNVYIACGVRILGGINIGNNVVIGANSVVLVNVPSNVVVAGIPAKVISTNISKFKENGWI